MEASRPESAERRLAAKLAAFCESLSVDERRSFDDALAAARRPTPLAPARSRAAPAAAVPPVIVYTVPGCAACGALEEFLAQRGIPATIRDVTADRVAARDLVLARRRVPGAVGVFPLVVVGDTVVIGFDPIRLNELLPA